MGILIDARTSMNISAPLDAPDPFPVNEPVLVGVVGLNVPPSTMGMIRVQFDAVVGILLPSQAKTTTKVILAIVSGDSMAAPIVYLSVQSFSLSDIDSQLITLSASNYNTPVPVSGMLVYSLFAIVNTSSAVLRSGPESFNASVYGD
ncbi:hypothetical protein [Paenibacillus sacheonensis]|uniref:Uncharacterized protein n=1 Tax=Paenibacillus sacheonensis TaxID=742054 RepID=A0A7X5C2I9_9BACL|nr:hypothetical protein [Paenibacillus sacheonensis]MBM7567572.1 hypothetical protein [Paenibacillus sacheonensis]NBC71325.1 hypothetical protein [Paenibacillus sacheonensis]